MSNIDRGVGPVIGVTTNSSATAGQVGEYLESGTLRSSAISLTTTEGENIGSLDLTPGDWDVSAVVGFDANASTSFTVKYACVSLTSETISGTAVINYPSSAGEIRLQRSTSATTGQTIDSFPIPTFRVSLSAADTLYLVGRADFTVSTATTYGRIWARRVR